MLISEQLIETNWNPFTQKYYQSKGYKFTKRGDAFLVKVEDLPEGSHAKVKVICDYCGKEYTKVYKDYFAQHKNGDCCVDCEGKKSQNAIIDKYGKSYLPNRTKEVLFERYGVDNPAQVDGAMDRAKKTNLQKYGYLTALLVPENREKCIDRVKDKSTQEKKKRTNLERYGYESPLASLVVREKIMETYHANGTVPTSSQQIKIYEMLKELYPNCELNKRVSQYALDCALDIDGVLIDVEYDGIYWHNFSKEKDEKRDAYLTSKGYKVLRILGKYKVPTKSQLKEYIQDLLNSENNIIKINIE